MCLVVALDEKIFLSKSGVCNPLPPPPDLCLAVIRGAATGRWGARRAAPGRAYLRSKGVGRRPLAWASSASHRRRIRWGRVRIEIRPPCPRIAPLRASHMKNETTITDHRSPITDQSRSFYVPTAGLALPCR